MTERRWSAQFVAVLESLRMPGQFQAGRRDYRAGRVRSLRISSSLATANVLDDDGATYRTRVAVRAFGTGDWRRIERELAQQARFAARLLAGQVPDGLEEVLAGFGLSLFPQDVSEIAMDCPCPSWQVPCRHLTATWYALADSFDRDPFGILAWRGRGRDELLDQLRRLRSWDAPEPSTTEPGSAGADPAPTPPPAGFWFGGPRLDRPDRGDHYRPAALLDQLDPLELTVGRYQVIELLHPMYDAMAADPSDPR